MIYAAAHSLGPALPSVKAAYAAATDQWERELVGGWDDWLDLATRVGDELGAALLGAGPGQVVVGDSTSVNLYKLLIAAVDARPGRTGIVVSEDEFPTDRYVVEGIAHARGLKVQREIDDDTAVVCKAAVDFRTGALAHLTTLTADAHAAGALMLWDVSHAVGVLPVELDHIGADLAVGCTYTWLAAGPGAPAFAYVRRLHHLELLQPIWGWFGQREQFDMGPHYDPEPDIRRFQAGTPPIVPLYAVQAAVAAAAAADVAASREKSLELTAQFMGGAPLEVVTPESRGGHVSLRAPDAPALNAALKDAGVVTDVRGDLVRFGFHPLTTSAEDVDRALAILKEQLGSG